MAELKRKAIPAAVLAALVTLVGTWEGLRTTAYQDIVGVWTVCHGYTHGVKKGDSYTPAECKTQLAQELTSVYGQVSKCFKRQLSAGEEVAITSLAYNVGVSATCKSTALRLMNEGKRQQGCDALLSWRFAGGKEVEGLLNRRKAERKVCLA